MVKIKKIREYISKKVDQYEIYLSETKKEVLSVRKNNLEFASDGNLKGLGVRVVVDGKMGFASTLNLKDYQKCVDMAIKIAKLNHTDKKFVSFALPRKSLKVDSYSEKLVNFDPKPLVKEIIKKANEKGFAISEGEYNKYIFNVQIVNSEGIDVSERSTFNSIYYQLLDNNSSFWAEDEHKVPLTLNKLDDSIERAIAQRNKKQTETLDRELILHPEALASFLSNSMRFNLNAENVQKHKSIFIGKLGHEMFDKKFTIKDISTDKKLIGSSSFDDEGVGCKDTTLIDKGVVKSFLHNSYTANIDGVENTANASRGYSCVPSVSPNNVVVSSGKVSKDDMISNIKKGIMVNGLLGLHTMDSLTGDFSVGANEALIIENGKVVNAVKDTMIAGNIYSLLKNIHSISKEKICCGGGYYCPYLKFDKIKVIGN